MKRKFGRKLKIIMNRKGVSIDALSKGSGVSQPLLSYYLSDKSKPSLEKAIAICKFLKIKVEDLV